MGQGGRFQRVDTDPASLKHMAGADTRPGSSSDGDLRTLVIASLVITVVVVLVGVLISLLVSDPLPLGIAFGPRRPTAPAARIASVTAGTGSTRSAECSRASASSDETQVASADPEQASICAGLPSGKRFRVREGDSSE